MIPPNAKRSSLLPPARLVRLVLLPVDHALINIHSRELELLHRASSGHALRPRTGRAAWNSSWKSGLDDGQLDTALDDASSDGVAGEAGGVVDVQFRHEMLAVFFDRFDADAQFRCGFLVGLALGNQLEDLRLTNSAGVKSWIGFACRQTAQTSSPLGDALSLME